MKNLHNVDKLSMLRKILLLVKGGKSFVFV